MLTDEQIQEIDSFFEKNGVTYYDLRRELTDHVSVAIENKMNQDETLSFDKALREEEKRFSRRDLTEYNFIAGEDAYNPLREWRYFTLRRVLEILFFTLLFFSPAVLLPSNYLNALLIVYVALAFGYLIWKYSSFRKTYKLPKQRLSMFRKRDFLSLAFPIIYFVYVVVRSMIKGEFFDKNLSLWLFIFLTFTIVFAVYALQAKFYYEKQQYVKAKTLYPNLFE